MGKQGRGEGGKGERGGEGWKDVKEKDETRLSQGGGKEIGKGLEGLYIICTIPRVPYSVCTSSELAPPLPLPQASVSPLLGTKGGTTLACGRGAGGANSDDWRESLALCLFCREGGGKQ
jgi:hypothetical protein